MNWFHEIIVIVSDEEVYVAIELFKGVLRLGYLKLEHAWPAPAVKIVAQDTYFPKRSILFFLRPLFFWALVELNAAAYDEVEICLECLLFVFSLKRKVAGAV